MSDNILSGILTFSLLAAGTVAIGSEMFETRQPVKAAATPVVVMPAVTITAKRAAPAELVVVMPAVTITAKRAAPAEVVTMPAVVVTGRREAVTVAAESRASETSRIQ